MENQQNNQQNSGNQDYQKDDTVGGTPANTPDPQVQNETGYAGTTNAVSEDRQHKEEYQIAIEDTMIGYDGDESQMNMDLGEKDLRRSGKSGFGDND
jgi:hypothetical protein